MNRVWAYLSIALSVRAAFIHEYGLADQPRIAQRVEQEKNYPGSTLQAETLDTLKNRHVFFIAGIMNELASMISSYYAINIEVLENELGVGASYYGPPSKNSIEVNARKVYRRILKTYEREKKPLIVVGHSKGGAELLYAILRHPELILNGIVDRVVLIQAAIHGSPLVSEGDLRFPLSALSVFMGPGILSLDQGRAKENLEEAFERLEGHLNYRYSGMGKEYIEAKRKEISDKIFYVRSYQDPNDLSYPIRMVLSFCRGSLNDYGKNDGLLVAKEMKTDRIGKDLGKLKSDHIGTTVYIHLPIFKLFNSGTYREQSAFTRAVLQLIYE